MHCNFVWRNKDPVPDGSFQAAKSNSQNQEQFSLFKSSKDEEKYAKVQNNNSKSYSHIYHSNHQLLSLKGRNDMYLRFISNPDIASDSLCAIHSDCPSQPNRVIKSCVTNFLRYALKYEEEKNWKYIWTVHSGPQSGQLASNLVSDSNWLSARFPTIFLTYLYKRAYT